VFLGGGGNGSGSAENVILMLTDSMKRVPSKRPHTYAVSPTEASDNNTFLNEVDKSFEAIISIFVMIADIAYTDEQKTKELDVKNNLSENQGMLFVFQLPARYGFWMGISIRLLRY
jgi:hypothetical protein